MRQPEGFSDIGAFYRDILSKESIFPFSTFDRPFKEIEREPSISNSVQNGWTLRGYQELGKVIEKYETFLLLASAVNSVHFLGLGHKGKPNGMPMPEDKKPHPILEEYILYSRFHSVIISFEAGLSCLVFKAFQFEKKGLWTNMEQQSMLRNMCHRSECTFPQKAAAGPDRSHLNSFKPPTLSPFKRCQLQDWPALRMEPNLGRAPIIFQSEMGCWDHGWEKDGMSHSVTVMPCFVSPPFKCYR